MYWLVWISERGPEAEKNLWIASSANGIEWSFPRKLALPEDVLPGLGRWREGRAPAIAFHIDRRNTFWLAWQGWLLRSDDAVTWQVDGGPGTEGASPDRFVGGRSCRLTSDTAGRLLLLANRHTNGDYGTYLWHRSPAGAWKPLTRLADGYNEHVGSAVIRDDGSILAITHHGEDLSVHQLDAEGGQRKPVIVESYLTKPFHPAIVPLTDGRWLVAFGSTEGIIATVFREYRQDMDGGPTLP